MEVQREMPKYKCTKIVHALKIKWIVYHVNTGTATITPEEDGFSKINVPAEYIDKHNPKIGGYYVVYEGGYKSWSPGDVFEAGYTRI